MKSTRTQINAKRNMTPTVVTVMIMDQIRGTLLVVLHPDGLCRTHRAVTCEMRAWFPST